MEREPIDHTERRHEQRIIRILEQLPQEVDFLADHLKDNDITALADMIRDNYAPVIRKYLLVYFRETSITLESPITIKRLTEIFGIRSKQYTKIKYELQKQGLVGSYTDNKKRLLAKIPELLDVLCEGNYIPEFKKVSLGILATKLYDELELRYSPRLKPNLAVMLALMIDSDQNQFELFKRYFGVIYQDTGSKMGDVWTSIHSIIYQHSEMFYGREQAEIEG